MSKQTLRVTLNGKEFTRTTERPYTHVLVGRVDQDLAAKDAFGWTPYEEKSFQDHLQFLRERAAGTWWAKYGLSFREQDRVEQANAAAELATGADAIREKLKADKVARYEKYLRDGRFALVAISWHAGEKNAKAALTTVANRGWYKTSTLKLIPVGGAYSDGPAAEQLGDLKAGDRFFRGGDEYIVTPIPTDYESNTWVVRLSDGASRQEPNGTKLVKTDGRWEAV
jgi:uncharacterized protein with GYD domain